MLVSDAVYLLAIFKLDLSVLFFCFSICLVVIMFEKSSLHKAQKDTKILPQIIQLEGYS